MRTNEEPQIIETKSLPELLGMLTDPNWMVRRSVVLALASRGQPAIEPLCEMLRTKRDHEGRIAATVDALVASTGEPDEALARLTEDSDTAVITDALQIFGRRRSEWSLPLLVRLTQHENDIVAVGAIEALGRIGGRMAVESLLEIIKGGNFFRTFPAIDILGRSGDRRVVEPLTQLLKNSTYLPEAARALGRSGERAALIPLLDLLKSSGDSVVRLAIVALWDLRERFEERAGGDLSIIDDILKTEVNSEMIRRISRIMSSLDSAETIAVCGLLGAIRNPEASALLSLKLDGPTNVAESAASALKRIGVESDVHLLRALNDGDSARRKILLPLVSRSAAAFDIISCFKDIDPDVRAMACETLARLGNPKVVPEIYLLLEDPNLRVVHAATAALQALGSRESRQLAGQAAQSTNPVVRRAALRILSYFGDTESLPAIVAGLQDPDPRVREVAIQGLPYLEDSRAYTALCDSVKSPDARTRALAVRSLAQIPKPDERIYSLLLKSLKDADAWVRYYACQTLGRLAYSPAAIEIGTLLNDEAGQVRVSAVEALSHLESREAHRALQRAATSAEPDVQRAALTGLGISHRIEDLPLVLAATNAGDVSTKLIALSAMIAFRSPLVLGTLGAAAADPDEQVRSTAISYLAARGEAEATEILVDLLSNEVTKEKAKTALLVPQVGRTAGILIALESASDEMAPVLISLLLRIQRPEARGALIAAMKLQNVAARKAAAAGLAADLDEEKRNLLREAADNDPDPGVREICTLLLSE